MHYDAQGRVDWIKNGEEEQTTLVYTGSFPTQILRPEGHVIDVTYNGYGLPTPGKSDGAVLRTTVYDALGQTLQLVDPPHHTHARPLPLRDGEK